ncbi:MAG: hypothetical protein ACR2PS_14810 [Pseudomonadales bacterium]
MENSEVAISSGASSRITYQWLPVLLALLAVSLYARFLFQNAVNVPYHDDILDVLKVIIDVSGSANLGSVVDAFFTQHNDHRTLASRLIYYVSYQIQGKIDFRNLTFVANLALPILALLFFTQIKNTQNRWLIFLPVVFMLFQLRTYGITEWAMAAFAFLYVYVYGIAALFCLHTPTKWRLFAAVVFAFMSTYSIASGQVVWLIGLLCLLHQSYVLKRISYVYSLCWAAIAALVLVVYRTGLETPNTLLALIKFALATPLKHAQYFLGMLGNAVSFEALYVAQFVGALLLSILLWQTIIRYRDGYSRIEYVCWFVVFSAATVALGRTPYSEVQYSQTSRYSVASILLVVCVWLMITHRYRIRRAYLLIAGVATASACAASYWFYTPKFDVLMEERVTEFNRGNYHVYGQPPARTNALVADAITKGIYHPPSRPLAVPATE